uniref:CTCK domain-containing protein n=1 Tax=Denticeps clupeoides TaxID=299321 RepID=A0AAY4EQX6_9TELE
ELYVTTNIIYSTKQVEVTSCEGYCNTFSMFSMESSTVQHSCSCCQEVSTSKKDVEMVCSDGSKFNYSYTYIEKCGCLDTECTVKETSPGLKKQRRRR